MSTNTERARGRIAALLCSAGLLGACVAPGALPEQQQAVAADWTNRAHIAHAPGGDLARWWTAFNDPALDALVARTLAQNLSLAQAAYRLKAARALILPAAAQRLPQFNAASSARSERSRAAYQAGFDASWELDLFGRGAQALNAARAGAGIADADARMARVSVLAEVVRTHIELRAAQHRRQLLAASVHDLDQLLALTRERRAAGVASDFEVDRALIAVGETAVRIPLLEHAIQRSAQRIAVLTADPAVDAGQAGPQPVLQGFSLALVPADLVRTRPEIARAEQVVAQAAAELGVSIADLYPRLSLSGEIVASGNLDGAPRLGRAVNPSAGVSITLPLLDWGARRALVNAREAVLAEAILAYRQAVLEGVEETENALNAIHAERRRAAGVATRAVAARRAAGNMDVLYRRGLASLTERLDAAVALREVELDAAEVTEQEALAVVALHKALGGASLQAVPYLGTAR